MHMGAATVAVKSGWQRMLMISFGFLQGFTFKVEKRLTLSLDEAFKFFLTFFR